MVNNYTIPRKKETIYEKINPIKAEEA